MTSESHLPALGESAPCPVTGLPITSRPEWTDVRVDADYRATFTIVGKAILLITLKGRSTSRGTTGVFETRAEVIRQAGLSDGRYAELIDYRMHTGTPSIGGRMTFVNLLRKEASSGHLLGYWVFGVSPLLRYMFKAGTKVLTSPIPLGVANDYADAVRQAVQALGRNGVDAGLESSTGHEKQRWTLALDGFEASLEMFGDDILWETARGQLREHHVARYTGLNEEALRQTGLTRRGYCYRVFDWEGLEGGSWKARLMYLEWVRAANRETPCRLSVIFGINRLMRALVAVNRPFVPFPLVVARDRQDAVEIMERWRGTGGGARSPRRKRPKLRASAYSEEQLAGFTNELLAVANAINWDQAGVSLDGINEEHPMRPVFDALAVIKIDLDELLAEHRRTEETLRDTLLWLENLNEGIRVGTYQWNIQTGALTVNTVWAETYGYALDELLPATFETWESRVHPDDLAPFLRQLERHFGGSLPYFAFECRMRHRDGHWVWSQDRGRVVARDGNGRPLVMYGTHTDITERRQLERRVAERSAELVAANSDLVTANKELETFSYSVSHDLRTPLRAINGFAALLERHQGEVLDEKSRRYLRKIERASEHLGVLIEELRDYSRLGRRAVRAEPVPLGPLVATLRSTFGERLAASGGKLESREPLAVPRGDPVLVERILANLVENALTYRHPDRAPHLVLSAVRADGSVTVSLADNGIGIPAEFREKVFEVFTRLHGDEEYPGGTGIGLSIVRKAARLMGSEVTLESVEGEGSTFALALPAAASDPADSSRAAASDPAGSSGAPA